MPPKKPATLGERLLNQRLKTDSAIRDAKMSCREAALAVGVHPTHLAAIEKDKKMPSWLIVCRLAELYHEPLETFRVL